jgi:Arc/MetJ-type ribon-helix-helix transcriptional regulator
MKSVRLPKKLEQELDALASSTDRSHSHIIREALVEYIAREKRSLQPYETGRNLFGKRGSGETDRSISYKSRIKKKISEKQSD